MRSKVNKTGDNTKSSKYKTCQKRHKGYSSNRNFNEKGKDQVLLLQKRQQPKLEVEKVLSLPILSFFVCHLYQDIQSWLCTWPTHKVLQLFLLSENVNICQLCSTFVYFFSSVFILCPLFFLLIFMRIKNNKNNPKLLLSDDEYSCQWCIYSYVPPTYSRG